MPSRIKVAIQVIAIILSVSQFALAARCSRDQFKNRVTLDSSVEYTLDYRISSDASQLIIALRAKTTGWLGLGFSESGHLVGSDMVGVAIIQGIPFVTDRFIEWDAFPTDDSTLAAKEDKCNNWKVLCSSEENGYTDFILSRDLDTRDTEDRPIVSGEMPIIFAWDGNDNFFNTGYHHGSTIINFYASTEAAFRAPSDADGFTDVIIGNFQVFDESTQSVLQKFDLGTTPKHVVAVEPIIHPEDAPFIEHIIVHDCGAKAKEQPLEFMPNNMPINPGKISPLGFGSCTGVIASWGRGSQSIVFPDIAGYRIGDTEARFVVLEVYVNNPSEDSQWTIKSGMRLHTTTHLRQKDIGTIVLGDSQAQFPAVSASMSRTHYESTCPSECLSKFGGGGEITVFNSFPHMHNYGKEIFTIKYEKNGTSSWISKRQYWNNNFQYQTGNFSIKLKPTDRLSTHCVYDTSKSNDRIRFGGGSKDEMCMEFLMYYPKKVDGLLCGYRSPSSTWCLTDQQIQGPNPHPDGLNAIPASVSIGEEPKVCLPGQVDPTAVPATQTASPSIVATMGPMSTNSPVSQHSLNPTTSSEATLAPSLEQSLDTRAPSIQAVTEAPTAPSPSVSDSPVTAPPSNAVTDELETKPPSKNLAPDQTSLSMIVALIMYVACAVMIF